MKRWMLQGMLLALIGAPAVGAAQSFGPRGAVAGLHSSRTRALPSPARRVSTVMLRRAMEDRVGLERAATITRVTDVAAGGRVERQAIELRGGTVTATASNGTLREESASVRRGSRPDGVLTRRPGGQWVSLRTGRAVNAPDRLLRQAAAANSQVDRPGRTDILLTTTVTQREPGGSSSETQVQRRGDHGVTSRRARYYPEPSRRSPGSSTPEAVEFTRRASADGRLRVDAVRNDRVGFAAQRGPTGDQWRVRGSDTPMTTRQVAAEMRRSR